MPREDPTCPTCDAPVTGNAADGYAYRGPIPAEHDQTARGLIYRVLELLADNKREYGITNEATDWFLRERRIEALLLEVVSR